MNQTLIAELAVAIIWVMTLAIAFYAGFTVGYHWMWGKKKNKKGATAE